MPSLDEQKHFYDQLWTGDDSNRNPHKIARLSQILIGVETALRAGLKAPFDICDLGSGTGWLANEMSRFGKVTGVELSQYGVDSARKRFPHVEFICANVLEFESERQFDLALSSEVIEHIENQSEYANKIASLLKPGGWLVLTCPNQGIRHYFPEKLENQQPIEKWLAYADLKKLFKRDFNFYYHNTFVTGFASRGIPHFASRFGVQKALLKIGLQGLFNALITSRFGMYHILIAKKK